MILLDSIIQEISSENVKKYFEKYIMTVETMLRDIHYTRTYELAGKKRIMFFTNYRKSREYKMMVRK